MKKVSFLIVASILLLNICPLTKGDKDNIDIQTYVETSSFVEDFSDNQLGDEVTNTVETNQEIQYGFAETKVGEYITFGSYEQDTDISNGKEDVEWLVLDKQDDRILVISKYALDCKHYNETVEDVTWETCTLRKWLNNDFFNSTFTDEEKAMIPTVTVTADANPKFDTDPGNDTQDKIFLLSINEAKKYFTVDSEMKCEPTDYAIDNRVHVNSKGICRWWLRSPGIGPGRAANTYSEDGGVNETGLYVDSQRVSVRPSLWITIK